MVRTFVRLNDSTGGVMTLTDKTTSKFGLKITLEPMTADACSCTFYGLVSSTGSPACRLKEV